MRVDPNYKIFIKNSEWYVFKKGVGYIPTDKAPKEAVDAMKKYNSYAFKRNN